ncbi:MAG: methylmalonyl-CoA mutase [Pseudomonadota bacterium]
MSFEKWQQQLKNATGFSDKELAWETQEGISLHPLYTLNDLPIDSAKDTFPGQFPFLRGPYAAMYSSRPWTVRQYAGFSTATESNAFYRRALDAGQQGISVAFDLPTHRGYDSDHPRVVGDVGKAGVAIDSVEDMKILFNEIPLDKVSVSMTMNGAVLPVLAAFIVAAEEQGVKAEQLRGTIQNDILKEFMVRNTYIYPPKPSMRITQDIMTFCAHKMPKFNSVSISGYHMQEAGADAALELAYTLADGLSYAKLAIEGGLDIDEIAPRLSFFFGIGLSFYIEVAKLRAARKLWAELIQEFNPKNPKSFQLRTHCQTSGWSLVAQDPMNNIVRTTIEAMAAVMGGTQSLHTNSFDEALALPSNDSARIALNTQLILQHETLITKVIDPWGGSYFMENLTVELIEKAKEYLKEIQQQGGMIAAIEAGIPQRRIQASAALRQARIDSGEDVIIGLNAYQMENPTHETPVRNINVEEVRRQQLASLQVLRAARNEQKVESALKVLIEAASPSSTRENNLLYLAIEAMRCRCTLGEVSAALESVWGRYRAPTNFVDGIYGARMQKEKSSEHSQEWLVLKNDLAIFLQKHGRPPRILIAKMGQDGHDRGAKVIASAFADLGFDVDLSPLFATPEEVCQQAIDNDVHVIGVSSQAGGHQILVPELLQKLTASGSSTLVVVGGIIPAEDEKELLRIGVKSVLGPGTPITHAARSVLDALSKLAQRGVL